MTDLPMEPTEKDLADLEMLGETQEPEFPISHLHIVAGDDGGGHDRTPADNADSTPAEAEAEADLPIGAIPQPSDIITPGHAWTIIATFSVGPETMEQLALARVTPGSQVNVDLQQGAMINMDGPGCSKCGMHWMAGYGQGCAADGPVAGMGGGGNGSGSGLLLPNGMPAGAVGRLAVPQLVPPKDLT